MLAKDAGRRRRCATGKASTTAALRAGEAGEDADAATAARWDADHRMAEARQQALQGGRGSLPS